MQEGMKSLRLHKTVITIIIEIVKLYKGKYLTIAYNSGRVQGNIPKFSHSPQSDNSTNLHHTWIRS
jgi:hypothetical protein